MGNDGGSIPKRRELVKEAAKNPNLTDVKEKQKEHLAHRWSQCPVSHKALTKPIVADYMGNLYNKDAVLQFLLPDDVSSLDKTEARNFIQGRITSLKDIVEVHFQVEKDDTLKTEKWLCPVTSKELGPNTKAVFLVPCGDAFSREAIVEMKEDTSCPSCSTPYDTRDVIPILPQTDPDNAFVIQRLETLQGLGLTHSLKKAGKSKKRKANGTTADDVSKDSRALTSNGTSQSANPTSRTSTGIRNTATASLTAKVLEEEEVRKKARLQVGENENLRSLYTKGGQKIRDGDFMTRGFSIPAGTKQS